MSWYDLDCRSAEAPPVVGAHILDAVLPQSSTLVFVADSLCCHSTENKILIRDIEKFEYFLIFR